MLFSCTRPTPSITVKPSVVTVRKRAYALWEQDPSRSSVENWRLAEEQLTAESFFLSVYLSQATDRHEAYIAHLQEDAASTEAAMATEADEAEKAAALAAKEAEKERKKQEKKEKKKEQKRREKERELLQDINSWVNG